MLTSLSGRNGVPEVERWGEDLAALAERLDSFLHGGQAAEKQTLLHGDPKPPNFFFRKEDRGQSSPPSPAHGRAPAEQSLGLIDFQWTGWGRAGTDLAYLLLASVDPREIQCRGPDLLADLVRIYCEKLGHELRSSRTLEAPGYESLLLDTKLAALDLIRAMVCEQWAALAGGGSDGTTCLLETLRGRWEQELEREEQFASLQPVASTGNGGTTVRFLSFNGYNKSVDSAAWCLRLLGELLYRDDQVRQWMLSVGKARDNIRALYVPSRGARVRVRPDW